MKFPIVKGIMKQGKEKNNECSLRQTWKDGADGVRVFQLTHSDYELVQRHPWAVEELEM